MTKIIATIHKNPYNSHKTEKIIKAGADVLRFNLAHLDPKDNVKFMEDARLQAKKYNRNCKIMADIPGSKIRIAPFHKPLVRKNSFIKITEGGEYTLTSGRFSYNNKTIVIDHPNLSEIIEVGETVILGDGEAALEVRGKLKRGKYLTKGIKNSEIAYMGSVSTEKSGKFCAELSAHTDKILHIMAKFQPDYITRSFVSSKKQILEYKKLLKKYNLSKVSLIAKIETQEGVDNIKEILKEVNGVMVARGDLGLIADFRILGINQKKIVEAAKKEKKIVIVSTQIIESIDKNFVPIRSDILDLTNIVLDGADMIMLCRETAHSDTPEKNIRVVKEIIGKVKEYKESIKNKK